MENRFARLGGADRTKEIPIAEWERVYRKEAQERRLLHQAKVLGWGKEKRYYYAHTVDRWRRHRAGSLLPHEQPAPVAGIARQRRGEGAGFLVPGGD